ncbi:6-phosphogluconolactonase [Saccharobesus litoralis]|uniref:6-phosphogluconolactonase n=1 Tax=Saccharobesus litoralis TaxID=2172099 RepID=A0A2S0VUD3_9ALTE|nr:6-phosphogluconolactonase [Saccharobesus litoralis]AWB67819.1 6-phosphogluconolactonase [Saccharobesus litoralis]
MNLVEYKDTNELNPAFAERVAGLLKDAIKAKGCASLVVSGGSTPLPFFKALSQIELAWDKVTITLADERWVDADHKDSNTSLVKNNLLQNNAAVATFAEIKTSEASAFGAEASVTASLSGLPQPLDVLILGMGEDGHTASLFPCSEQIAEGFASDDLVIAVQPTTAPHERMSLTLKSLLNAQQIFLHIVGKSKKDVLDKALAADDKFEMPIRAILQQNDVPVDVIYTETKL